MPALYPSSGDSDYNLWRKILTNPGGTYTYSPGEPEHSIKKKILRNQGGTLYPNGTDSEEITVRKILRNQAAALVADCGASSAELPSTNESTNRSLARLLINQGGAETYSNGIHDNAILKKILRNQATAVDAAAGDLPTLENIRKVIGPCGGGTPPVTPSYIEIPFITNYNWSNGFTTYTIQWRGFIQFWNTGTVVFLAGEGWSNNPSNDVMEVWVGSSRTVGAYVTIDAITGNSTWNATAEKIISPAAGESVYFIAGDRNGIGYLDNVPAIAYPGGWQHPIQSTVGHQNGTPSSPAGPYHRSIITRIADTIHWTGDWVNVGSYNGILYSWDWYDTDDWSSDGFLVLIAQSTAVPGYDYSQATFADATRGPAIQFALSSTGSNLVRGGGKFGPFLRAAPVIQYGTDPG